MERTRAPACVRTRAPSPLARVASSPREVVEPRRRLRGATGPGVFFVFSEAPAASPPPAPALVVVAFVHANPGHRASTLAQSRVSFPSLALTSLCASQTSGAAPRAEEASRGAGDDLAEVRRALGARIRARQRAVGSRVARLSRVGASENCAASVCRRSHVARLSSSASPVVGRGQGGAEERIVVPQGRPNARARRRPQGDVDASRDGATGASDGATRPLARGNRAGGREARIGTTPWRARAPPRRRRRPRRREAAVPSVVPTFVAPARTARARPASGSVSMATTAPTAAARVRPAPSPRRAPRRRVARRVTSGAHAPDDREPREEVVVEPRMTFGLDVHRRIHAKGMAQNAYRSQWRAYCERCERPQVHRHPPVPRVPPPPTRPSPA